MYIRKENGITDVKLVIFIITFFCIISFLAELINDDVEPIADGFTINSYDVSLDVKEDNVVEVTENIGVDWYESNHHGIFKFTPQWLEYTGKDGKTIKRKSIVSDYQAVGEKYSIDTVQNKPRIKIGDANKTVGLGLKNYTIKYDYDMGKDPYKDGDEFIFHFFGDYWGTEIENPSIEVKMPKKFDKNKVKFFADKYRKEDVTKYVNYYVSDNILYARFDGEKYSKETSRILEKSLTLDIELPEGYFEGGSWNYGYGSVIFSIVILVLTGVVVFLWFVVGRDFKKENKTIEFYPPDDLTSAEIGYVYGNKNIKKLTISLIISIAAKGYIKIDKLKDEKIQISSNAGVKPKEPKDLDSMVEKRHIDIAKLKNIDTSLSNEAKKMMKYLFKKGNIRVLNANFDKFQNVRDELVNGGYIEIKEDNTETRWIGHEKKRDIYEEEYKKYTEDLNEYNLKISKLPPLNKHEKMVFDRLFEKESSIILSEHKTFYKVFSSLDKDIKKNIKNKVRDIKSDSKIIVGVIITIISFIMSLISFFGIEDMDPKWSILYKLSFACIPINLLFTIFMGRKTKYGEAISARINGFRDFLNTAEKYRLEELVDENPQYFYNILPYTYVLGISKKWMRNFENIQMSQIDMGNFDYSSDSSWTSFSHDIYTPPTTSSGGGSSSSGGGCSSCGGGCSSCGGGGSW